jgi:hypothetical protein
MQCLSILRKSVEKILFSLKSDKNIEHFTWRPMYMYDKMSLNYFNNEVFQIKVVKQLDTFYVQ